MGTIDVEGVGTFEVDDSFAALSPEEQLATVDDMVAQVQGAQNEELLQSAAPQAEAPGFQGQVPESVPGEPAVPPAVPDGQEFNFATFDVGTPDIRFRDLFDSIVGQGAGLGFGDEIEAALISTFGGDSYEKELKAVRDRIKKFKTENPGMALTGEVLGGFIAPGGIIARGLQRGAGLLRSSLAGAAAGGATGAVAGAGGGETIDERIRGATFGGGAGTVLGGAAPAVMRGVGTAGRLIGNQVRPGGAGDQAVDTLSAALARDRITPGQLGQAANRLTPGTDATLADAAQAVRPASGANVLRTGRAAASVQGPGAGRAQEFLEARQAGSGVGISEFIDTNLGTRNFEPRMRAMRQALREEADAAYGRLHSLPDVPMDADLARFFANPRVRRSYRRARSDAMDEDGIELPPFNEMLQARQVPVRVLDWMQRRMRRETDSAFRTGEASAAAKRSLRERFLGLVDGRVEGFRGVRQQYADGRAADDARASGERFALKSGTEQRRALEEFDGMTAAQQDLFRLGAAQKLNDEALNATRGADLGSRFLKEGAQRSIRRVFGPDAGEALLRRLETARIQTRTNRELLQGSRTAPLLGDMEELASDASVVANVATGNIRGALGNVVERVRRGITERNADEILRILLETDPQQQQRILSALSASERRAAERLLGQTRANLIGSAGLGAAAGQVGSRLAQD